MFSLQVFVVTLTLLVLLCTAGIGCSFVLWHRWLPARLIGGVVMLIAMSAVAGVVGGVV